MGADRDGQLGRLSKRNRNPDSSSYLVAGAQEARRVTPSARGALRPTSPGMPVTGTPGALADGEWCG